MTRYTLPDLPFARNALEPAMSAEIVELHHDKHHRAYVKGANDAIEQLLEARAQGDFTRIAALERALAFNVSGHVLHSMYWRNLSPNGSAMSASLSAALRRDFGTFDLFREQLIQVAMTIMGSGWAALVWDPITHRLGTTQIHDHQSEITQAGIPLLVLDAWEHAYYLQYKHDKQGFFEAVWDLWNWDDVSRRFDAIRGLDLLLPHTASFEQAEPQAPHPRTH